MKLYWHACLTVLFVTGFYGDANPQISQTNSKNNLNMLSSCELFDLCLLLKSQLGTKDIQERRK